MLVRYIGTYRGEVSGLGTWSPGEEREIENDEVLEALGNSPLFEVPSLEDVDEKWVNNRVEEEASIETADTSEAVESAGESLEIVSSEESISSTSLEVEEK